ncbi:MAG TPA: hypothetical protein PKY64_02440 [Anaerolineaceae bacterium]|nr:hypothetical protein [Anaerolineaceae bacterium]
MNAQIAEKVRSYSSIFPETGFLFTPAIPQKKVRNAIKSYAPDASESEVLLLLDTTVFGSAKDGLLLTSDALYAHPLLGKATKVFFKEIVSITLEETEFESWTVHINDPQNPSVADIKGQEAQIFAQLLKEVKALLAPGSEVIISEITRASVELSRISQIRQPRLVPVEGGKLKRYNFINLYLQGSEWGKIINEHSELINPKVVFQGDAEKILAVTNSKNVSINGEPFSGTRQLVDGDLISLGKMKPLVYQFQANAITHKQLRIEREAAQGFKRYEGSEKPTQVVHSRFIIDANGIKLRDGSGDTQLFWADISSVSFSADYDFLYKATTNLGNAAGQGLAIGGATVDAMFKSQQLSDVWAFFPAPNYKVLLGGEKMEGVDQYACTMLDKGIELFAPMDLVIFK